MNVLPGAKGSNKMKSAIVWWKMLLRKEAGVDGKWRFNTIFPPFFHTGPEKRQKVGNRHKNCNTKQNTSYGRE